MSTEKRIRLMFFLLALSVSMNLALLAGALRSRFSSKSSVEKIMSADIQVPRAPADYILFSEIPDNAGKKLAKAEFTTYRDVRELPYPIPDFYGIGKNGLGSGVANPGEPFRSTHDAEHGVPYSRLKFAARTNNDDLWVIAREVAWGNVIVDFLHLEHHDLQPLWQCTTKQPIETVSDVSSQIGSRTCK